MKILTISGCKDCPCKFEWSDLFYYCNYKQIGEPMEVDPNSETPPRSFVKSMRIAINSKYGNGSYVNRKQQEKKQ